uniref:Uncharacterized protein n=1 Tax=Siphoviridae sp. ctQ091 TaxID=2825490 RepID=A0A8S5NTE9_9CAUD|nr:MAG TPA: hypothetical protein [Siphoviridae sp. ctQ091]
MVSEFSGTYPNRGQCARKIRPPTISLPPFGDHLLPGLRLFRRPQDWPPGQSLSRKETGR